MHTSLRFATKLPTFAMSSSSQPKIDSSNRITPPILTIPFAVTTPFTLLLSRHWPAAVQRTPTTHIPTTRTNRFQQCHP